MKSLFAFFFAVTLAINVSAQSPHAGQWHAVRTPTGWAASEIYRSTADFTVDDNGIFSGAIFSFDKENLGDISGRIDSNGKAYLTGGGQALRLSLSKRGRGTAIETGIHPAFPDKVLRQTWTIYRRIVQ